MSEVKKNVAPQELNEEELDLVAAGAYTTEEWAAMTVQERIAAQQRSMQAMAKKQPCELL